MKRIWFKKDCIKWIIEGKKITTFRSRKHIGEYEIVQGSRFKAKGLGIFLKLSVPMNDGKPMLFKREQIIDHWYDTEGDFQNSEQFTQWLDENKLVLPEVGYLCGIEVIKK